MFKTFVPQEETVQDAGVLRHHAVARIELNTRQITEFSGRCKNVHEQV
jgi:hypothetical protein